MNKTETFVSTEGAADVQRVRTLLGDGTHRYFIETYGCQMNARDSQTIAGLFEAMGYVPAPAKESADAILFNTCCVREGAEERLFGNLGVLRTLKEEKPELLILVTGCMMQEEGMAASMRRRFPFVDVVFGTHNTHLLPSLVYRALTQREPVYDLWKDAQGVVEGMPAVRQGSASAYVNIMFGCDNFCSYCIVPYVRGRERSRRMDDIAAEAEELAAGGVTEITLLGQNVNSYGKGLGDGTDFPALLRRLNRIDGLRRIRFMTSHPKDLSDRLIEAMAECEKVCHYLHLPLQSGSDRLLKLMNRRYNREDYFRITEKLRAAMPDIALSTDLIVGFPTETEEDFADTLELYERVCFNSAYTFLYSPRRGTPAARMEGQIPEELKKERLQRLLQVSEACTLRANAHYLGKTELVLAESFSRRSASMLSGRCDSGRMVSFPGDSSLIGTYVPVKITEIKLNTLAGVREDL